MKKLLIPFLFVISFTGFSYAQSATTMQDIMDTVSHKVIQLEEMQNQEVVNVTFDLIVGQGSKTIRRFLDPSFAYNIMLIGDRRISKVKIAIQKKETGGMGDIVPVDSMSDARPVLRIEPQEVAEYTFNVSVSEFYSGNNTGRFALLLYHKNPERGN